MNIIDSNSLYYYWYPWDALNDEWEIMPFYNDVPFHTVERKVASRLGTMWVEYINFHSNTDSITTQIYELFQFDLRKQHSFSEWVELYDSLHHKDQMIKNEILYALDWKKIYQAQPYSQEDLKERYDPSCLHSLQLNDKLFMQQWIPGSMLQNRSLVPYKDYPFVAKLSRSSAWDATDIIRNDDDLQIFLWKFGHLHNKVPIFYEKFVSGKEYGIEFFRSTEGQFDVIALIESVIDTNYAYAGWLLHPHSAGKLTDEMKILVNEIKSYLEKINRNGRWWLDVIEDESWKIFVIDPNIRTTQIMPAAWDMYKNDIEKNMMYSWFTVNTTNPWWIKNIQWAIEKWVITWYSGTIHEDMFYGDWSIMFDQDETLEENKQELSRLWFLFPS